MPNFKTLKAQRKHERYKQLNAAGLDCLQLRQTKAQLDVVVAVAIDSLAKLQGIDILTAYKRLQSKVHRITSHARVSEDDKGNMIKCE